MLSTIQKYFKINASEADLRQETLQFDSWPEWWPGVQDVKVVKSEPNSIVLDLVFNVKITLKLTIEVDPSGGNIIKFRQLKGWFKSYGGDWTLLTPPDGVGITLKYVTQFDVKKMIPMGMVHSKLSESLDQLEGAVNKRMQGKAPVAAKPAVQAGPAEVKEDVVAVQKSAHIFQTEKELEVWIAGRRYLMNAVK